MLIRVVFTNADHEELIRAAAERSAQSLASWARGALLQVARDLEPKKPNSTKPGAQPEKPKTGGLVRLDSELEPSQLRVSRSLWDNGASVVWRSHIFHTSDQWQFGFDE